MKTSIRQDRQFLTLAKYSMDRSAKTLGTVLNILREELSFIFLDILNNYYNIYIRYIIYFINFKK